MASILRSLKKRLSPAPPAPVPKQPAPTSWSNDMWTPAALASVDVRARVAASLIAVGTSVLDVGCGTRILRTHLPRDVTYLGVDKNPVSEGITRVDLDAHEFPEGRWDYVVMLGVLSWITERAWTLERAAHVAEHLILTRRDDRFDSLVAGAGWMTEESRPHINRHGQPVEIALYSRRVCG